MAKTTMVKTNYQSIDECGAFTGEAFSRMQTIRKIIKEVVPGGNHLYQIPAL